MGSALNQGQLRSQHEIAGGAGHQHLTPPGFRRHTRTDVERDPRGFAAPDLALAGMNAGTNLEAEIAHAVLHRDRRTQSMRRDVEHDHEPVAGALQHSTPETGGAGPNQVVMALSQLEPTVVAELDRAGSGIDDVRE